MTTSAALDVVIVAYQSRELLRECLASLHEHAAHPLEIVVVDNNSRDGTVEMVRQEFPGVDAIEAVRNLGFARAMNLGIERGAARYVLALNPDTRITAGALDRLAGVLDERPDVAAAGPLLELPDGAVDHAAARSFPTPLGTLGHFTGMARRRWARGGLAQYRALPDRRGPVDLVSGACMLLRRSALEEVGGFDEGYWLYMEDIDLSYRLAKAGWITWYEPQARVLHVKRGSSAGRPSLRLVWSFHAGMWRFYRRHYAPSRSMVVNGAVYAGIAAKLGLAVARRSVRRGQAA